MTVLLAGVAFVLLKKGARTSVWSFLLVDLSREQESLSLHPLGVQPLRLDLIFQTARYI